MNMPTNEIPLTLKDKKTLSQRASKLKRKAADIERAALILIENEVGDGFDTFLQGHPDMICQMVVDAANRNEDFAHILQSSLIKISVQKLDVMLEKKSLF